MNLGASAACFGASAGAAAGGAAGAASACSRLRGGASHGVTAGRLATAIVGMSSDLGGGIVYPKKWLTTEARLLKVMGVLIEIENDHTMDLHSPQIQGFFRAPVDDLYAMPLLAQVKETVTGAITPRRPR